MNRILFLDIDGVLNSRDYMVNRRHLPRPTRDAIDAVTVPRLNAITDRTGAKIVVSSTWRLQKDGPCIGYILRAHGVTGEVIGVTPWFHDSHNSVAGQERGFEIQAWLDANPGVVSFAILDDDNDMVHLESRLVKTSFQTGLLDEHVERVVAMLGEI